MRDIIDAICEVVKNPMYKLKDHYIGRNRANSMGESLETYIKDIFAGTVNINDIDVRMQMLSDTFSYLGNTNNPPDSIIRGSIAIEVKKIESNDSSLALNSSYPKPKLYSNSSMISTACRECEEWIEKDMLYCVGVVKGSYLKSLSFVYGEDYCANKEVYERIKTTIKNGVESISNVEFAETNELGRVNRVDPLGITYLRVRGMWGIENPFKVFSRIYKRDYSMDFNFMAIINDSQMQKLGNLNRLTDLQKEYPTLSITKVKIPDPNNLAIFKGATLITYKI
ncbi:MAG: NgoPII family restriction endonuclease [Rikenellaceae bacterium]